MKFELSRTVRLIETAETGTVIARAEYLTAENSYLVRYRAADGRQVENWWGESAITED